MGGPYPAPTPTSATISASQCWVGWGYTWWQGDTPPTVARGGVGGLGVVRFRIAGLGLSTFLILHRVAD